ncbi:ankyrin repeat protein [Pedobacter sp. UYP24]
MKKLLLAVILCCSVSAFSQKNILLDQTFWQTKPDTEAIKAEVVKGANPSQLNGSSFDPVVLAINGEAPFDAIIYLITQPGNDVNKLTHDGRTYLHWAASKGNTAFVAYLIKKGAKVALKDSHGFSPMGFAANAGQQDTRLYDLFLANGVNIKTDLSGNGANALLLAVASDKELKLTDYFVSKGLDLNSKDEDGYNAFGYAARSGNVEALKALLKKGVIVDQNAIIMAGEGSRKGGNSIEVFQYLESLKIQPAQINKEKKNVLHALVRRPKQDEVIQHFLSEGVDVNQADVDGNTVFMYAAMANRDTSVLGLLLPKVKNINQANEKGITALAMAVNSNSSEVVRYLLSKGADVKATDKNGNSLSFYLGQSFPAQERPGGNGPSAAEEFDTKLTLLQEKGLDLKVPQKDGSTLYHLAVVKGNMMLLKRLEILNIDINAKDAEGFTALHKAAMVSKDDAILKYLLSMGAKKDVKTNFEETAYDLASENESFTKSNVNTTFLK